MSTSKTIAVVSIDQNIRSERSVKSKIRVIHIVYPNFGFTFSGTTKHTLRLFREWNEPNIELTSWGSDYFKKSIKDREQALWRNSRRHTRAVRLKWAVQLALMLIRKRDTFDIVHIHILWWGTLLVPLLTRLLGKKTIYHMTLWGSDNPSAVRVERFGLIKMMLFRQFNGIIGLSPALIHDCHRHDFEGHLVSLPGFLVFDPPTFPDQMRHKRGRKMFSIPLDAQVLLFVGSVISRKGVDILIDAFIQLAHTRPNLWLVLVGPHTIADNPRLDEEFVTNLKDKLKIAVLEERSRWLGLVTNEEDLIDAFVASNVFVFPTRAEGQGYVIAEAMSCSLPIVCSHLPGITDVMIQSNESGYLIEVDNLAGFIEVTGKLVDNESLCLRIGAKARESAIAAYGFHNYCKNLANYYRVILNE